MSVRALARKLVSIPSHDDPAAAGSVIAEWLRSETDAVVERTDAGVIARRDGGGQCALVGHHDVVPPADKQRDDSGYVVNESDDRLYGRGSADMKGSLAAALCAFRDADGACTLASFRGEEQGGLGAKRAIDAGFAPAYAVVIEGSTGYSADGVTDVAIAHKGRRASTIHAQGTAAHASEPEHGTNAVYRATEAVAALRELSPSQTEVFGHELRGRLCVTEIEGGSAWNVVPDACTITVDERTVPGERADLGRVTTVDGVEWDVEQDLPPMACEDDTFAQTVLDVATDAQPDPPALVTKPHATDAGWLAQAGTTCIVCGAAEPGEAHTDDESVSVPVLERCYRIYRNVLASIRGTD